MANDFKENSFMTDKSSAKDKSFNNQASTKSSSFSDTSSSRDNPRSNIVDRTYDGTVKWGKDGPDFYDKRGFQDDTAKQKWMDLDSSISADKFLKERNAEKGNTFLERGDSVKSGFFDKVEVSRGERGAFHIDDARVDKLSRNISKNQGKLDKAVNKSHYRMEKVYDREKGTYTFKPVKHDIKSRRRSAKNISKGKEFVQKRFNEVTRIAEGQIGQDEEAKQITNAAKFVENGASRTAFKIYDDALSTKEKRLNRKANALTKKTNKLRDKVSKDGFLLEGRKNFDKAWLEKVKSGDASSNSLKRAFQKNQIKKKYQKDAIKKFRNSKKHGFRALFSRDKATRLRGFNELKKKALKYLLIFGLIILLIVILFGGCALFLGLLGGGGIVEMGYKSDPFEVQQADLFFSEMEMKLVKGFVNYEGEKVKSLTGDSLDYTYNDGEDDCKLVFSYQLPGIKHDSNVLIAYLSAAYGYSEGFKFNEYDYSEEMIQDMMSIFYDMYHVTPKWEAVPWTSGGKDKLLDFTYTDFVPLEGVSSKIVTNYTDDDGIDQRDVKLYLYLGNYTRYKTLEEVIGERLGSLTQSQQDYYETLMLTKGLQQLHGCSGVFKPGSDMIWQEQEMLQYYGYQMTGLNGSFVNQGWNPNNRTDPCEESYSKFVQFKVNDPMGIRVYSPQVGTIEETYHRDGIGGCVKIKYSSPQGGYNYLYIEGLSSYGSGITAGATVTKDQYLGRSPQGWDIRLAAETDTVKPTLDGTNFVNPFFAID